MAKFLFAMKNPWDCANFVSQSLNAGGIETRNDWFNDKGNFNFWGQRTDKSFSINWTTANGLVSWLRKQDAIYNGESLIRSGKEFTNDLLSSIKQTKIGDIIGWSKSDDGKEVHHVGIVTKIEGGKIYYDAHTTDRKLQELKLNGDKSIVIIHIRDEAQ